MKGSFPIALQVHMPWEGRDDEGIDLPLHSPRLSRGAVDGEAVEIHGEDLRQGGAAITPATTTSSTAAAIDTHQ